MRLGRAAVAFGLQELVDLGVGEGGFLATRQNDGFCTVPRVHLGNVSLERALVGKQSLPVEPFWGRLAFTAIGVEAHLPKD